jgi:hypothetical protein
MLAALLRLADGHHRHGRTGDISKAAPGGAKKRQLIFSLGLTESILAILCTLFLPFDITVLLT